jgi:AbrB family looped-hinge helix DNA binding protein
MLQIQTKLTSQGQVSVPAAVRNLLNLTPGSVLVWKEEGGRISVERAVRHSTAEVHQALFDDAVATAPAAAKTPEELKQGIRQLMKRRHAGR